MNAKMLKAFKALGEPTRMKIIKLLSINSMCVCEISEVLDMLQPRISQHLKVLKEADVVKETKEGYWVYYSLNRENLHRFWQEFLYFLDIDINNIPDFAKENIRLKDLSCNERIQKIKENLQNRKD